MGNTKRVGWLEAKADDKEFHKLLAREDLIEDFLHAIEEEMARTNLTRSQLARRIGCKPANITRIMRRTTNLTAATMVDMAFALDLQLCLDVRPGCRKWFDISESRVLPFNRPRAFDWKQQSAPSTISHGAEAVAS